jgi:hypothetical protein
MCSVLLLSGWTRGSPRVPGGLPECVVGVEPVRVELERHQLRLLLLATRQCPGLLAECKVHGTTSTGILARQDTT